MRLVDRMCQANVRRSLVWFEWSVFAKGEYGAAAVMAQLGAKAEVARELAYRCSPDSKTSHASRSDETKDEAQVAAPQGRIRRDPASLEGHQAAKFALPEGEVSGIFSFIKGE